jgi:hypothetical protein
MGDSSQVVPEQNHPTWGAPYEALGRPPGPGAPNAGTPTFGDAQLEPDGVSHAQAWSEAGTPTWGTANISIAPEADAASRGANAGAQMPTWGAAQPRRGPTTGETEADR